MLSKLSWPRSDPFSPHPYGTWLTEYFQKSKLKITGQRQNLSSVWLGRGVLYQPQQPDPIFDLGIPGHILLGCSCLRVRLLPDHHWSAGLSGVIFSCRLWREREAWDNCEGPVWQEAALQVQHSTLLSRMTTYVNCSLDRCHTLFQRYLEYERRGFAFEYKYSLVGRDRSL